MGRGSCGYRTVKGTAGHYLASPEDTGGRFSLYRWDMSPASGGPGPHFHRTYDETFYILTGTIRLHDGTRWFDASPGDMLYVPAGGIHGFTNTSGAHASMLMLLAPGADRAAYFGELAAIAASGRELSGPEWAEVFARHDNVMLPATAPDSPFRRARAWKPRLAAVPAPARNYLIGHYRTCATALVSEKAPRSTRRLASYPTARSAAGKGWAAFRPQ